MALVKVFYQHRVDGTELINHEKEVKSPKELYEIIDNYPWKNELALSEQQGEGGGFYVLLGNNNNKYARYQFVPVALNQGFLDLDIVSEPGFLNLLGRKSLSKHLDIVSIAEAKHKMKELFDYPIDLLYKKYK